MDEASADTVLSLQIADVDRLLEPSRNAGATPSNYQVVLTAHKEELAKRLGVLRDRRMSRSIANAVLTDQGTVATVRKEENGAISDQVAARELDRELNQADAQALNAPPPAAFIDLTDGIKDCIIERYTRINSLKPEAIELTTCTELQTKSAVTSSLKSQLSTQGGSTTKTETQPKGGEPGRGAESLQGAQAFLKRKADDGDDGGTEKATKVLKLDNPRPGYVPQKRTADEAAVTDDESQAKRAKHDGAFTGLEHPVLGVKKTCASCNDSVDYFAAVYAPCGHDYCGECAKRLFIMSMKDESLFPPRCCRQAIPLAAVDVFMTAEAIQCFQEKSVEYTTVDKTYCAWPTCSAFIPPSRIHGDIAVCPECSYWVCTMCKKATHQGRDCPKDTALAELSALAKQVGWQRCYRCKRYVELKHGCNHITYVKPSMNRGPMLLTMSQMCVPCRVLLCLWTTVERMQMPTME
ncbi:MAG: hypothetical protein L6R39_000474 [Caloplaca ligustica]|nr:MAG: hypothetical protein L6R39_000474 [Caloplaca ligustica]